MITLSALHVLTFLVLAVIIEYWVVYFLVQKLRKIETLSTDTLDTVRHSGKVVLHYDGTPIMLYGDEEDVQLLYQLISNLTEAANVHQERYSKGEVH